jgi:hypothetical protein
MDYAVILARIVGGILLFFAIKSGVKHIRDDLQSQGISKNSNLGGIVQVLTRIETGMDRCAAFLLKYTGIMLLSHFATFLFSCVETFFLVAFKYVIRPVFASTGVQSLSRTMTNAASNLSQSTSSKETVSEKPPSTFSVIAEKTLNKLLLYLWITFMFAFSLGMIVNN